MREDFERRAPRSTHVLLVAFAAADASHEQGSNGARPSTSFWASNSGVASGGGAAGTPQPRSFSKH